MKTRQTIAVGLVALGIGAGGLVGIGCHRSSRLAPAAEMGPAPELPPPATSMIPTVEIAQAVGWPSGGKPTSADGLQVAAFSQDLEHPRWLYVLPNGDVLVAETNAPPKPDDTKGKGMRGWMMKRMMKHSGSAGPSANRISLLRDVDGDHVAETRTAFLEGLNSPFGMALVGNDLYVANTDALVRFPYSEGATRLDAKGTKVVDLPAGTINHHWTKNVVASADGSRLYVTVGSNSNAGENGMDVEAGRAAIWEIDPKTGEHRVFATGLRNPVGLAWRYGTHELWTAVNERDELGDDVPPDYMTLVKDSGFYGWPYSYFGRHVDPRVKPPRPDLVATALVPSYALGAHTASLGLAWATESALRAPYRNGMFVGQHGSWNRKPRSGYKVVFVPFDDGTPTNQPIDVLTGFLNDSGEARGRPVGVAISRRGELLVADDVGNRVWCVSATAGPMHAERLE